MEDHLHKIILRDENSHKGAFGHAFVVGGNKGYGGAAILAAKAAEKKGIPFGTNTRGCLSGVGLTTDLGRVQDTILFLYRGPWR